MPQSRSESRSVGKDDSVLVPQSRSGSRSVGKDDSVLVPQSRSESRSVGKDDSVLVPPRGRDVFESPQGCSERTLSAKTKTRARRLRTFF